MNDKDNRIYICIDLKSFYASVECAERNLDPLNTNLVVADSSRTEKTICLAVSPSLKAYGLGGRARLFEVVQKVKDINYARKQRISNKTFEGKSYIDSELKENSKLELDYITAVPRMKKYIEYSTKIYNIYLKYVSEEDIFVYSIDEAFIDITKYLPYYHLTAKELVTKMINDVFNETHITATAGIGTNMYLAKVAMDIVAKHTKADKNGVRIAGLDEMTYRKLLWNHTPLTDFWRIGPGIASKLYEHGMFTMGDIARVSLDCEDLLYKLFGINAELIIDHAWGYEPVQIEDVKKYKPKDTSLSVGQVLHRPYTYKETKTIIKEMAECLALDLNAKHLLTDQIVLTIGYDIENLSNPLIRKEYTGEVTIDRHGRSIPKYSHGTINIKTQTNANKIIIEKSSELFERVVNKKLLTRRINITATHTIDVSEKVEKKNAFEQMDLFTDYEKEKEENEKEEKRIKAEEKLQRTVLSIKNKFGKNAILKGFNLKEEGTTRDRNNQVGGHKA